jgi:hypothetical protein
MKVKITLAQNAPASKKLAVITKVHNDLGAKVTIQGDVITVDEGNEENKVITIVNREGVNYSRSK